MGVIIIKLSTEVRCGFSPPPPPPPPPPGVMEHSDGTSRNIVQDLLEKKLAQMVQYASILMSITSNPNITHQNILSNILSNNAISI